MKYIRKKSFIKQTTLKVNLIMENMMKRKGIFLKQK